MKGIPTQPLAAEFRPTFSRPIRVLGCQQRKSLHVERDTVLIRRFGENSGTCFYHLNSASEYFIEVYLSAAIHINGNLTRL